MRKIDRRKVLMGVYFKAFNMLYEEHNGNAFVQSILDRLYQYGRCSFSKKERMGHFISTIMNEKNIHHEIEPVDDATFDIVLKYIPEGE